MIKKASCLGWGSVQGLKPTQEGIWHRVYVTARDAAIPHQRALVPVPPLFLTSAFCHACPRKQQVMVQVLRPQPPM